MKLACRNFVVHFPYLICGRECLMVVITSRRIWVLTLEAFPNFAKWVHLNFPL
jgi:hypothetical protein